MKLTEYSRCRVMESAAQWEVDREYFEPIYNYLIHGFEPGSFWSAVMANDFFRAMQSSHPSNQIPALKKAAAWIRESLPIECQGNPARVQQWLRLSDSERREILEQRELIYTEKAEVEMALKGRKAQEPHLW
jgi:predicted Fe-S protein YdhL (DUF1289 family)